MVLKIDKNVPLPTRGASQMKELALALRDMEIGDSVFVENKNGNTVRATCSLVGRRYGRSFVTRAVTENGREGVRVWRVEDADRGKRAKVEPA
jgi:hypothetical protein